MYSSYSKIISSRTPDIVTANQEVHRLFSHLEGHYCVSKHPPLVLILNQTNPPYFFTPHSFTIHFNITILHAYVFQYPISFTLVFQIKICSSLQFALHSVPFYPPPPYLMTLIVGLVNKRENLPSIKLLITKLSQSLGLNIILSTLTFSVQNSEVL
jgi:hypothetical protein